MAIVSSLGVRLFADTADLSGSFAEAGQMAAGLVTEFISATSHIADLSERTSISATQLQRLSYVGDLVGVSMDQIGSAATMLQRRLGSGNDGTVGAVTDLGLSFDHLKTLDPGVQFEVVAQALGRVDDATQRAALGQEIFGRGWATILPLAKQNMRELGDEAEMLGAVMGDRLVKAGDDAGDAWTKLTAVGKGLIAIPIAAVVDRWNEAFRQMAEDTKRFPQLWDFIKNVSNMGDAGLMPKLVGAPSGLMPAGLPGGMSAKEIADVEKELNSSLKEGNRLYDDRIKKLKEFNAWLADGPIQWKEGLSSMPGQNMGMPKSPYGPDPHMPPMLGGVPGGIGQMLPWANPQTYMDAFSSPTLLQQAFGSAMQFGNTLGTAILSGWSGLTTMVGDGIGSMLSTTLGNAMSKAAQTGAGFFSSGFGKFFGGAIQGLLPLIGPMLAPLISTIGGFLGNLFNFNKGRDAVVDFAEGMGGFTALHNELLKLGPEGEAAWIKLTQGTPGGDKNAAQANIQMVIDMLNKLPDAAAQAANAMNDAFSRVRPPNMGGGDYTGGGGIRPKLTPEEIADIQNQGGWTSPGGGIRDPTEGIRAKLTPEEIADIQRQGGWTSTSRAAPVGMTSVGVNAAAPVINMTVNGSADKDFARRLIQAIGDGGSLYSLAKGTLA